MKRTSTMTRSKLFLALLAILLTSVVAATASAESIFQPLSGQTCVAVDEDFAAALEGFSIFLSGVDPAFPKKGRVCFPVRAGGIDSADLRGETSHAGGLAAIQEDDNHEIKVVVELINFVIDTTGDDPVLTGLVFVDGRLIIRLALFDLDLSNAVINERYKKLSIRNVGLTLTKAAAEALNGVFFGGEEVLMGNENVGVADVKARGFVARKYGYHDKGDDDDDKDDRKGKNRDRKERDRDDD